MTSTWTENDQKINDCKRVLGIRGMRKETVEGKY